ncbi:MAG TPA: hypothetical protein VEI80_05965 [Candidatus Acidoferrales bacterium]|nr:hypothetical protein [Candidatus Acidoferrales bacterium]
MKALKHAEIPETARFTRYYEHDGMLRAYANRAMFLAIFFGVMALGALGFAIHVGIAPPTVIRINEKGEATIVGGGVSQDRAASRLALVLSLQASHPSSNDTTVTPTGTSMDIEGKAVVRRFLEHYLAYTPDSAARNFAEALNMMTVNLRTYTMGKLRDEDTIGKIHANHIIADFRIRWIEPLKASPWSYTGFGVKEVHRLNNGSEVTDRIVARYDVRLVEEERSEFNPSGLLVAEYTEREMVGDHETGLLQESELNP